MNLGDIKANTGDRVQQKTPNEDLKTRLREEGLKQASPLSGNPGFFKHQPVDHTAEEYGYSVALFNKRFHSSKEKPYLKHRPRKKIRYLILKRWLKMC